MLLWWSCHVTRAFPLWFPSASLLLVSRPRWSWYWSLVLLESCSWHLLVFCVRCKSFWSKRNALSLQTIHNSCNYWHVSRDCFENYCSLYFVTLSWLLLMFFFYCLDALAACNYLPQSREKIIAALFKALNSTNNELQEAGEACMRKVSATSLVLFPLLLCNRLRSEW